MIPAESARTVDLRGFHWHIYLYHASGFRLANGTGTSEAPPASNFKVEVVTVLPVLFYQELRPGPGLLASGLV